MTAPILDIIDGHGDLLASVRKIDRPGGTSRVLHPDTQEPIVRSDRSIVWRTEQYAQAQHLTRWGAFVLTVSACLLLALALAVLR